MIVTVRNKIITACCLLVITALISIFLWCYPGGTHSADDYYTGNGIEINYVKARELYLKEAANGNVDAMYMLGVIYERGCAVDIDYKFSLYWYKRAAIKNYAIAMYECGRLYEWKFNDIDSAMFWYKKGADAGELGSLNRLKGNTPGEFNRGDSNISK